MVDRLARVIDGIDGAKVRIQCSVNRFEVRNHERLSIGQKDGIGGKRTAKGRLLAGRNKIQVESKVSIRLPGYAVRVAKKLESVAINIVGPDGHVFSKLVLQAEICLLDIRAAEIRCKNNNRRRRGHSRRKSCQAVGKTNNGTGISESRAGGDQKLPGDSIGEQSLSDIQQVLLNVVKPKASPQDSGAARAK